LQNPSGNSTERFQRILAGIAAEPPEARSQRWRGEFDRQAGPAGEHLVLFGSGQFGQWVLGRLRKAGVEPLCFSDNNRSRWGSRVDGIEVVSPSEAAERYGNSACFVVTIYNGSAARKQLRDLGCKVVLPAALLFWKHPDQFMPDLGIDRPERLVEEAEAIRECIAMLADERSRQELCDQLEWRYWMRPEYLPLPANEGELYFPPDLVRDNGEEVLVDCGAFDGDSVRSFVRRGRGFRHIYAMEPDAANLERLNASVSALPEELGAKVTVWPYAVGDKDEVIRFVETHDVSSRVSTSNEGVAIDCRRLDSLPWKAKPTYIKMDIEGAEPWALAGAAELLRREMPVLAICLYHRTEHLWQIPNQIHALSPQYAIYVRRYAEDCWEQVCYAVPPNRMRGR
jgi:FkbM family methyltransferase